MKRKQMSLLIIVLVTVLALQSLFGSERKIAMASVQPQCEAWSIVTTPPHKILAAFGGVATISPSDAWAVGVLGNYTGNNNGTLTEHWNGSKWSIIKSPNLGISAELYAVAAVATNDVWAVGAYNVSYFSHTFILHWNGTQWRQVRSPDPSYSDVLTGVAAISTKDVWAVGSSHGNGQTLIEHWDGTSWSVARKGASTSGMLTAISAGSTNDVWAVGIFNGRYNELQVVEHWNGSSWRHVGPSEVGIELHGVTAISPDNVWAVGYTNNGQPGAFIEHWDGKRWHDVPSPSTAYSQLNAVTMVPGTNLLWAAGYSGSSQQTLTEFWDGTKWSIVPTPTKGFYSSEFLAIAASDVSHIWAMGTYETPSYTNYSLAESYC